MDNSKKYAFFIDIDGTAVELTEEHRKKAIEVYEKYKVDVVIHMDPVILDDEELNNYKRIVINLLKELHPEVSTHDFRLVKGKDCKRLFFDCAVTAE